MRAGRKSEAQTPAPIEDRIYGSSKNAPNTATRNNADKIVLSEGIENTLRAKLEVFLKDNPDQKGTITLSDLKAVFRRGAGAYSKSHRPTITGGVPNSRNAWAYARVNKFLQKAGGMKVKKAYIQDDDLMKYEDGGMFPKDYVDDLYQQAINLFKDNGYLVSNGSNSYTDYGHSKYFYVDVNETDDLKAQIRVSDHQIGDRRLLNAREFLVFNENDIFKVFHRINAYFKPTDYSVEYFDSGRNDDWKYQVRVSYQGQPIEYKMFYSKDKSFDLKKLKFADGGETPVFGSVENSPYRGFTEEEVMAYDFPEIYKIAEKHHIGSKTIHTEFIKGVFHEQEHTSDWGLSAHTSLQHLWEVPDYYTKLDAVKLAKGGKVKQGKGDCYQTSGTIAIDGGIKGVEFVGKPYVVHAEVRGQGDLMGVRFGHSWVEDDEFVYDYSNGKDLKIPKFFYYYLGDIQKVEPKYYRYTFAEAKKKMLESGHFGSWELETESGL